MSCIQQCDFAGNYERSASPAMRALEKEVLGCDYGGTSWTTLSQAQHAFRALQLDRDRRLLEIGSGSGWPALYLGNQAGCRLTLVDLPLNALEQARDRARIDGSLERVSVVNGDATALPFADGSFDALGHSDVLCCLPEKAEMLAECRRVAQTGAYMHFSVIEPAHGLAEPDLATVVDTGPPFVGLEGTYPENLADTGWELVEHIDVTREYADCLDALARGLRRDAPDLEEIFAPGELEELWLHREAQRDLAIDIKMIRTLYTAIAA